MLALAGLLGLMAVGGVSLMALDFSTEAEVDDDSVNDDEAIVNLVDDPTLVHNQRPDSVSTENQITNEAADIANSDFADEQISVETDQAASNESQDQWRIHLGDDVDDTLDGTDTNDQMNGFGGNDILSGGGGSDILHGNAGEDSLNGGADNDTVLGEDGSDLLFGGDGDDALYGHFGDDQLQGGAGEDTLYGGQDEDNLAGGDGDDALHGGYGNDTLIDDNGQDTLFGGAGNDNVSGWNETTSSIVDADFLNGGQGNDTIIGGSSDIITAGSGADQIILGDWIVDGEAADVVDFDPAQDRLLISWDLSADPNPQVEVQSDPEHANLNRVLVNGEEIALLRGSGQVSAADVMLIDHDELDAMNLVG